MVFGKKNSRTGTPEPEPRREEMPENLPGLIIAKEAAQRFLDYTQTIEERLATGATVEQIKKSPELRRLKRASLDLSSELVIMRKELP